MQGAGQTDCEHKYRYLKVLPFVLRTKSFPSFTSRRKGQWTHSGYRSRMGSCAFLGYYAAYCGNSLLMFRDNLSVPYSGATLDDGTVRLSQIVC